MALQPNLGWRLLLLCGIGALGLSGCGSPGGSGSAEDLRAHRDEIRAELLLKRAELVRAELDEAESTTPPLSSTYRRAVKQIKALTKECKVGDGLEPCPELENLEGVEQDVLAQP